MEVLNAFIGKTNQPTERDLTIALRPSALAWKDLVDWLAQENGVAGGEWNSTTTKSFE